MAKNKTKSQERLTNFNSWYSQDKDGYKKFAESKRLQTRFTQEALTEIFDKAREYIVEQKADNKPLTVSGFLIACECNRTDFKRMKHREYDWRLYQMMDYRGISGNDLQPVFDDVFRCHINYWIDADGAMYVMETYGDILERIYLMIQEQLEVAAYDIHGNPTGVVFLLKVIFGWTGNQTEPMPQQNGIHIATKEEAKEACRRLFEEDQIR